MSDASPKPSTHRFVPHAPFDDTGADVILRSSDGIDFHVHRLVLSLASPFFKDMFTLPQPNSEPDYTKPDTPVILMSESALVLDRALRFWYPGAEPTLEALIPKYDIHFIIPLAKSRLRGHLEEDPVGVFAIACGHQWKDLALQATKSSLRLPIRAFELPRLPQLRHVTAETYHTLLHYHSECSRVASEATLSLRWATPHIIPGHGCEDPMETCPVDDTIWVFHDHSKKSIVKWFSDYLKVLTERLVRSPVARLDDPKLLSVVVKQLAQCRDCRKRGFAQLMKFSDILKTHIETRIKSVRALGLI
ncbi:hypothetical protein DFH07DRAFT_732034 [Mycena maculata]|uniref:BTB domain-containing protein n=1 Tax=Mycena maculata TaxID=230809 RepID=A0AAD7K3M6_9AGAR|nr:hypothetical protein DFH07DRAFT_732034 [Mycena maculata]